MTCKLAHTSKWSSCGRADNGGGGANSKEQGGGAVNSTPHTAISVLWLVLTL